MTEFDISFLHPLSPESKAAFQHAMTITQYPRNHYLFQPEQTAHHAYFVLHGAVRQFYLLDGKEIVTRLVAENDICVSLYSFVSGKPGFEYGETLEDTTLAAISRAEMERLCWHSIEIANLERTITEQYLVREHERTISLQCASAQERYEQFFQHNPHLMLRLPLGTIASYLGMSQETMSRLRAKNI
jgi:CRP/FNR family transcriptional regulator, anaerobic regulatory protein